MDKIKTAFQRAITRASIIFFFCIIFFAVAEYLAGEWIEPIMLIKLWSAYFVITILIFFRVLIDNTKWALNKPYIIKNIMFAPLFLTVALVLSADMMGDQTFFPRIGMLVVNSILFIAIFSLLHVIAYFMRKSETDAMNEALHQINTEK